VDNAELILEELKSVSKTMTEIQVAHGRLDERSQERHDNVKTSIDALTEKIGSQNGRVRNLEDFKTTILTKIKVIPATISVIIGVIVSAITLYLRTSG